MNTSKLASLLLASFSLTFTLAAYADKKNCPVNSVHCAYMTGLSDAFSDGRYIKLSNEKS